MDDSDKGDALGASGTTPPARVPDADRRRGTGTRVRSRPTPRSPSSSANGCRPPSSAPSSRSVSCGPAPRPGELGPRSWKGLFVFLGTIFAIVIVWTSVHVVQPGNVAVPVTFGTRASRSTRACTSRCRSPPRTRCSTRTQNYTMSTDKNDGPEGRGRRRGPGARPGRWRGDGQRDRALPRRSRQGHDGVPQPRHATTRPRSCSPRRAVACAWCSRTTRS